MESSRFWKKPLRTYRVGSVDTSVNDVGTGSSSSAAVVDVGRAGGSRVGDSTKTPGGTGLGDDGPILDISLLGFEVDGDDRILLDELDLGSSQKHALRSMDLSFLAGNSRQGGSAESGWRRRPEC